jgi:hypothetical protein
MGSNSASQGGRYGNDESTRSQNTEGLEPTQNQNTNTDSQLDENVSRSTESGDVSDRDVAGTGTGSENAEGMESGPDNENKA